jgi:hypothetical protein
MTTRRNVLKGGLAAGIAAAPGMRFASSLAAQEATPAPAGLPIPEGCVLVAGGLLNPRFLAIAEDGSVYVTEAGAGGEEALMAPPGSTAPQEQAAGTPAAASPTGGEPVGNRGATGQVTRIGVDGAATVVASGLSSYVLAGLGTTGPAGIAVSGENIWVAVGGPGPFTSAFPPNPTENSVVAIDEATGEFAVVADIGANEVANNPEPANVDSNLYGLAAGADGLLYVADAGGNTVYRVDSATGDLSVLAVLEPLQFAPPTGAEGTPAATPEAVPAMSLEPVPTGVVANADGSVLVGLLSGGPFPVGAAQVVSIGADGAVTPVGTGLTMVTDVRVGPDGHLYAVQISMNFLAEVPAPGNVVRVLANGTLETVVDNVMLPNGIAFDAAGNLYLTAGTESMGGPPIGMLLRCDGVAAPA